MPVILEEQETTINIMRDSELASIYTSDTTMINKLDKLAKSTSCPDWKLIKEEYDKDGNLVGKRHEVKKRLISFRSDTQTREMTEEQRKATAERLRKWREKEAGKSELKEVKSHREYGK